MARWFVDRLPQRGIPSVSLRGLLPGARFVGCPDWEGTGCAADHRRLDPGQVFVAVRDARYDGHDHLAEALERGAAGVIVERVSPEAGRLQVIVDDAGRVWAVDRITRYMPLGSGQAPEHKGKLLRLNADGRGWEPVSSVPEAYYRMIKLPGSDRLYAYGHNYWTDTDHITTNASPLP